MNEKRLSLTPPFLNSLIPFLIIYLFKFAQTRKIDTITFEISHT